VCPGAYSHIVAGVDPCQQARDLGRIVLAIRINEHKDIARCFAGAGLDRSAVAPTVVVMNDAGTCTLGDRGGLVFGSIIYNECLGIR
jgi:hypothetical protein